MGRHPRRHSLLLAISESPEEALAFFHDQRPSRKEQIPACIVEGLLGILFQHFLTNRKQKGKKIRPLGISEEAFVGRSIGIAQVLGASYSDALSAGKRFMDLNSEFRLRGKQSMEEMLKEVSKHPDCLTLQFESDIVLRKLKGYDKMRRSSDRLKWFQTNLSSLLNSLHRMHTCPHNICRPQINLPDEVELDQWAKCANLGRIRHLILAHFHRSTESTVKKTLSS
jgi:hypothetical protein